MVLAERETLRWVCVDVQNCRLSRGQATVLSRANLLFNVSTSRLVVDVRSVWCRQRFLCFYIKRRQLVDRDGASENVGFECSCCYRSAKRVRACCCLSTSPLRGRSERYGDHHHCQRKGDEREPFRGSLREEESRHGRTFRSSVDRCHIEVEEEVAEMVIESRLQVGGLSSATPRRLPRRDASHLNQRGCLVDLRASCRRPLVPPPPCRRECGGGGSRHEGASSKFGCSRNTSEMGV